MYRHLNVICHVALVAALLCLVAGPGLRASGQQDRAVVTATGCLDAADPDGPAGGAPFVLKNATGGRSSTYGLVAGGNVDLAAHVGHRVQVRGVVSSGKALPTITVQALELVAASCAG